MKTHLLLSQEKPGDDGLWWSFELPARRGHRPTVPQSRQHLSAQADQEMHVKLTVKSYFIPTHWRKWKCRTIASVGKDVEFL